ncbi:hypothetical protein [Neolewinella antarctica]|uniref:Uncharacterized protein n=1 Tax=Neolewinella antarctica TaxID=442734 RepID=A0ABX0X6R0_9BACT|nr:hypothetical protein [Neolewinella antarctica]NJC24817.1 hypothetical protein [Neolewinella antarctica]
MLDQQPLFDHFANQHDLSLLHGEMDDIIMLVLEGLRKEGVSTVPPPGYRIPKLAGRFRLSANASVFVQLNDPATRSSPKNTIHASATPTGSDEYHTTTKN